MCPRGHSPRRRRTIRSWWHVVVALSTVIALLHFAPGVALGIQERINSSMAVHAAGLLRKRRHHLGKRRDSVLRLGFGERTDNAVLVRINRRSLRSGDKLRKQGGQKRQGRPSGGPHSALPNCNHPVFVPPAFLGRTCYYAPPPSSKS